MSAVVTFQGIDPNEGACRSLNSKLCSPENVVTENVGLDIQMV